MSKEINVNDILKKYIGQENIWAGKIVTSLPVKHLFPAIKDIVEAVLEEAAENATLTDFAQEFMQEGASEAIEKSSITNTINQVKF